MVSDLAGVSPVWGLTAGAFAATGAVVASANGPGRALAYRVLCWLGAGAWSCWALATSTSEPFSGPWSTANLAALAAGTIGAAFTGRAFQSAEQRKEGDRKAQVEVEMARLTAEQDARAAASEHDAIAVAWERELRRQTRREVKVVNVEFWNPNTGFTLDLQLPPDGTGFEDIKPFEKTLAQSMNVPLGCAVEVVDPHVSRQVLHIRVGTFDALAKDHHLKPATEADTIENPISIGIRSDGSDATINLRYNCAVLVGQTDSGKSNELNVITDRVVRCTDALAWAIDLTGHARYPRPWVRAWYEGRATAPALDWVAPTADEARLMTLAALEIVTYRTADYEQMMFENGWDKIMVSPEIPEIVITVDEFGSLPDDVKENLRQISDTGRGAGVRVASCALEANNIYIPRAMINQSRERIGMRVQDEAQLQYLFDTTWKSGRIDTSTLRAKGMGMWSTDASLPERFKGWRLEPSLIDSESITVGPWRPVLDEVSAHRCDTLTAEVRSRDGFKTTQRFTHAYSDRWQRTLPLIFPARQGAAVSSQAAVAEANTSAGSPEADNAEAAPDSGKSLDEAMADLEAARQRLREIEPVPDPGPAEQELPPLPAEPDYSVVESWLRQDMPDTNAAGSHKPYPRRRVRQLVWDAGDTGIGPTAVHKQLEAEGYVTTYPTVNGWMKEDAASEVMRQERDRAPYTRGPRMANPHEQDQD
ncbi:hypothetical protein [Salinispora arenicola]|uniref:hypothetical protein n=1 Tax=Salinispora arenicola TaxID=168697 RepID=UPI0016914BBA|nr:hypothetical protein [Salinispora arenicola]NIL57096.1 hypothetical protein [Salinispora arenicola]NIL62682.1 hypothetical protein [Salinispora arenicola]